MTDEAPKAPPVVAENERVVFGAGTDQSGMPIITLGVSQAAWEYMRDGKAHTFDLRVIGIPLQILLFGGDTQESIRSVLEQAATEGVRDLGVIGQDAPKEN